MAATESCDDLLQVAKTYTTNDDEHVKVDNDDEKEVKIGRYFVQQNAPKVAKLTAFFCVCIVVVLLGVLGVLLMSSSAANALEQVTNRLISVLDSTVQPCHD